MQRALAHEQRAAVVERERGVGAHLQHKVIVRHRVLVVALGLIGITARIEIAGAVGIGGMRRIQGRYRLVIAALGQQRLGADAVGDREVLSRRLLRRDHLFAGIQPRLGLGLAVAAGLHVVRPRGA